MLSVRETDVLDMARLLTASKFFTSFSIGKKLGKGGFGSVFSVIEKRTNQAYALKCIQKADIRSGKVVFVENEIEIGKLRLNHENILTYIDSFEVGYTVCVLMEKMDGDLCRYFDIVHRHEKLPEWEVSHITRQLLSALQYLERMKIVHRDVS